jgi:predicted nucleotidyltransferase
MNPGELEQRLRRALERRPEVLEAYLFGSQASGRAQPHSDIDVAVYLDESRCAPGPFGYVADLATDLISALGRNDVEVAVLNHAPPLLYHRVLRDGRRLMARDLRATTAREGYAVSRYCDWVPQLEKIRAARRAARAVDRD